MITIELPVSAQTVVRKISRCLLIPALMWGAIATGRAQDTGVDLQLTNGTGMSSSQIWIQFLGGSGLVGSYTNIDGQAVQLQSNTSYSLDELTGTNGQADLDISSLTSGRIYVSYGAYGMQNISSPSYVPAAELSTDPNYNSRYQYFEATVQPNSGGSTFFGDLSYIDSTAISLSMQLTGATTLVQNSNLRSSNSQTLISQALTTSIPPTNQSAAITPAGATANPIGNGFARILSPAFASGTAYASFQPYLTYLNGQTVTIAGTFVGTGPQPSGNPSTIEQTYYYTASFTGSTVVLVSNTTANGLTDVSWIPGAVQSGTGTSTYGATTITIQDSALLASSGIYGDNPIYTITNSVGTSTTSGITNDVYGRAVGDLLAGLDLGYVGSVATGTGFGSAPIFNDGTNTGAAFSSSTAFGQMPSSLWWTSGEALSGTTFIPVLTNGTFAGNYLAADWDDTPASQNYIFGTAFTGTGVYSGSAFYDQYAAALADIDPATGLPYSRGYGFPLQDRLGNNLLSYSTVNNPDAVLNVTVNPDGTSALPTGIWTATASGTGLWTNAANWYGGMVPVSGASVQFVGSQSGSVTVDTGTNQNVSGIYFNYWSGAFTINNNTITLAGNIVNSSTVTQTINSNLALTSDDSVIAAFGNLVLGGTISTDQSGTAYNLTFDGTMGTTVTGAITGSGGITKINSGTLTLTGASTFSGGVNHEDGTLEIGNNQAVGTGTLTLSSGTAVNAVVRAIGGSAVTLQNPVALNGNLTVDGTQSLTFAGATTILGSVSGSSAPVAASPTITNTASVSFDGPISEAVAGSGFTKTGSGTMTLGGSQANTFTGTLSVNDGTLVLAKTSGAAFGGDLVVGAGTGTAGSAVALWNGSNQANSTANVTVNTDGQMALQGFSDTIASLTMMGGSVTGTGNLTIAATSTTGGITFQGTGSSSATIQTNLTLLGASAINVDVTLAPVALTITGTLSGTDVSKGDSGVLVLENNAVNGTLSVGGGILETSSASNANVTISNGLLGAVASSTSTQTVDINQLTVTGGGLYLGLAANQSDTVNVAASVNLDNDTLFYFHDAGLAPGSVVTGTLVTSALSNWAGTDVSGYSYLSTDISGLVGSFTSTDISGTEMVIFTGTTDVTGTWSNAGAGGGVWENGTSWASGTAPAYGSNIVFGQSPASTVTTSTSHSIGSLTFTSGASAYNISGNSIVLSGNLVNSSTNTQTITNTLKINGSRTIDAAVGNLVLQDIALSPNAAIPGVLTFSGSGNTTVNGTISDGPAAGGSVTMDGSGTLFLTGSNSFTGATTFASGVVSVSSIASLGSETSGISPTVGRPLYFEGGTLQLTASDTITSEDSVILNSTSAIDVSGSANELTVDTVVSGSGGLIKTGQGTLGLFNSAFPNTYTGSTIVQNGILAVSYVQGLGATAGVTVESGSSGNGTLLLTNPTGTTGALPVYNESLTLSGSGYGGQGALEAAFGGADWGGTITLAGDATIQALVTPTTAPTLALSGSVDIGANTLTLVSGNTAGQQSTIDVSGALAGTGTLVVTGDGGIVVLSNQSGTAFTGQYNVAEGTLNLLTVTGLDAESSSLVVQNGATFEITSGTIGNLQIDFNNITLSGSGIPNAAGTLNLGAIENATSGTTTLGGSFTLAGDSLIYTADGALNVAGNINLNGNTLESTSQAVTTVLSGVISGTGGLASGTAGILELSGSNTFTGSTDIFAQTAIQADSASSFGAAGNSITVHQQASLELGHVTGTTGIDFDNYNLALNGVGLGGGADLINISGTNTWTGNITLNSAATIQSNSGELILNGTVNANGNPLLINGPGTTFLSGTTNASSIIVQSGIFATNNLPATTVTVGSAADPNSLAVISPGDINNIETINLQNVVFSDQGSLLEDVGASTYDQIVTTGGPAFSGTMTIFIYNKGFTSSGTTLDLITTSAGIDYSGSFILRNLDPSVPLNGYVNTSDAQELQLITGTGAAVWENTDGSGTWADSANWTGAAPGEVPMAGSAVAFDGTATVTTTVITGGNQYVGGLSFTASSNAVVIGNSNTSTITTYGNIENDSPVLQTIASNVALDNNVSVNATSGNIALTGSVSLTSPLTANPYTLTTTGSHNTTISGVISGGSSGTTALYVSGTGGSLTLTANNTYSGTTEINAGTLILNGSIGSGSPIMVDQPGTLAGTGTAAGMVGLAGTITPGQTASGQTSPGNLTTGSQIWGGGGNYNWLILDATGSAGVGTALVTVNGTLDLSILASGTDKFAINLWSLSGTGANGPAGDFLDTMEQSWTLVDTTGGIIDFNAADFVVNTGSDNGTAGFANATGGGTFSVSVSGNGDDLMLNFTAASVPEPSTWTLMLGGTAGILLWSVLRNRRRNYRKSLGADEPV